jgi:hypothetical protein
MGNAATTTNNKPISSSSAQEKPQSTPDAAESVTTTTNLSSTGATIAIGEIADSNNHSQSQSQNSASGTPHLVEQRSHEPQSLPSSSDGSSIASSLSQSPPSSLLIDDPARNPRQHSSVASSPSNYPATTADMDQLATTRPRRSSTDERVAWAQQNSQQVRLGNDFFPTSVLSERECE